MASPPGGPFIIWHSKLLQVNYSASLQTEVLLQLSYFCYWNHSSHGIFRRQIWPVSFLGPPYQICYHVLILTSLTRLFGTFILQEMAYVFLTAHPDHVFTLSLHLFSFFSKKSYLLYGSLLKLPLLIFFSLCYLVTMSQFGNYLSVSLCQVPFPLLDCMVCRCRKMPYFY